MPVDVVCEYCGASFRVKPFAITRGRGRFCSKKCMYAAKRIIEETTCEQCGQTFRPFSASEGRFCSNACYTNYRLSLSSEERAGLMANATAVIRGSKRSHDELCKRARTKQERASLSGDEAEIMAALNTAGLFPIPLFAFDKYNIDFAFVDYMVAVEYNGGNWHNTPVKRAADEVKAEFLRAEGWTLLTFPRLDKPQANDAGNRRITVDEIVRQVDAAIHR